MVRSAPMSAILRVALFSAALAGFILAFALAASPGLHEWAHQDSGGEQHQCLATALHAGACSDVAPEPVAIAFASDSNEAAPEDGLRAAPSLFLSCRILEHAPPSVS